MRSQIDRTGPRAVSPVLGVVLLVAVTACLAVTIAVAVDGVALDAGGPYATFALSVDADDDRVVLEHVAGDRINTTETSLAVAVEDEPLDHQPPIPFFAATGFVSGPTGPFNPSGGTDWSAGESGSFRLASTNDPSIDAGDRVTVSIVVDGDTVATVEAAAS